MRAWATSFTAKPLSLANSMSFSSTFVIPSQRISAGVIQHPKARLASRPIFWAASPPLTSSVGSASAKPFFCACARASSKESRSSLMRVRM